jgi:hypothetical protein
MSTFHYLTPGEKAELAKKREINPGLPLTYEERAIMQQAEATGRQEVKRAADQRAAAKDAAIPDHQRRPPNHARTVYDMQLAQQWNPSRKVSKSTLASLKKNADTEDARIDLVMSAKELAHKLATDKNVQRAVQHADLATASAVTDDERNTRAELGAIAREGDYTMYWERASALDLEVAERQKEKLIAEATDKSAATVKWEEQRTKTDAAYARHAASLAEMQKVFDSPTPEDMA